MSSHMMQEIHHGHSDSDELVDIDQDDEDDYGGQHILGENHVMLHDDHLSSHPSDEDDNHQDTGDDQNLDDFF